MFLYIFIAINIISFIRIATDKKIAVKTTYKSAKDTKKRMSEVGIITWASFGGTIGILLAFSVFRHKSSKSKTYLRNNLYLVLIQNIVIWSFLIIR
jgi:uncharacterized membrane protein YsdA (DUF1294 family)